MDGDVPAVDDEHVDDDHSQSSDQPAENEFESSLEDYVHRVRKSREILINSTGSKLSPQVFDVLQNLLVLHDIDHFFRPNIILESKTEVLIPTYGQDSIDYLSQTLRRDFTTTISSFLKAEKGAFDNPLQRLKIEIIKLIYSSTKPYIYPADVYAGFRYDTGDFETGNQTERAEQYRRWARPHSRKKTVTDTLQGDPRPPIIVLTQPTSAEKSKSGIFPASHPLPLKQRTQPLQITDTSNAVADANVIPPDSRDDGDNSV